MKFNKIIVEIVFTLNYLYSIVWIAAHRSNKWEYRDNSKVHAALIKIGYRAAVRLNKQEVA